MARYLYMIKAPTPSFTLPGLGYVRKKAGETLILNEQQKLAVESPAFQYGGYFIFVEELPDESDSPSM